MIRVLKENLPRLIGGILVVSGLFFGVLYLLGIPLWETAKTEAGKFDGQILFSRTMKEPIDVSFKQQIKEIFIMDLQTSMSRQLTDHKTSSVRPEFSPIGPWIVYTSYVFHEKEQIRNADLFIYNLLTRERKLLSYKKGLNLAGSFSDDGKSIYYTIKQGDLLDIFQIGIDGKDFKQITHGKKRTTNKGKGLSHSSEPAISPDGSRMAFVSDRDGRPTLYIRHLKTQEDIRIIFTGKYNTLPRWSPMGEKLVFQGYLKRHFDVFEVDATGRNLRQITRAKNPTGSWANNESPDFSPDGKQIIFTSDRTGYNQLYIIDVDRKNETRLTYDTYHYFSPRWGSAVLPTEGIRKDF